MTPEVTPKPSSDAIMVTVEITQQTSDKDAAPPTARSFGGSKRAFPSPSSFTSCFWPLAPPLGTIIGLAIIVFVIQFGNSLSDVPGVRLLEDLICQEHYGNYTRDGIDEEMCKGEKVQGELNVVSIGQLIAGFIPGFLVALVFGSLADRWGRKPVLALAVAGMILSNVVFIAIAWAWTGGTIRTAWASAVPLFIGGGNSVAEAMVFAIISDLSTEKNRATHFQIVISAVLLAQTLAPLVAKPMMDSYLWLPVFLSPGIAATGALFLWFIPETLHLHKAATRQDEKTRTSNDEISPSSAPTTTKLGSFLGSMRSSLALLARPRIPLIFPTASLAIPITTIALNLALRYLPLRYGISISTAGVVIGIRTLLSIIVLLLILPLAAHLLSKRYPVSAHRDLRIAQVSAVFLVAGLILTAAAPETISAAVGLVIFTLGSGVPSLTRALLADMVQGGEVGRLFGLLAMGELLGYLISALGLGAIFQGAIAMGVGEGKDGAWLGLPFYVAAGAMLLVSVALWCVRSVGMVESHEQVEREEETEKTA